MVGPGHISGAEMQSAIDICNVALSSYLGTATITAFDEPSVEAEQCKLHYDRVRRSLLEKWHWTFAGRRELLVAMAVNDRESWLYRYAKPGHLISIRWVNNPISARQAMQMGQTPDTLREVSPDSIYSDVAEAVIDYTRDETDPTLFSSGFGDALAAQLAAAIAMPVRRDAAVANAARDAAASMINDAMVADFNARPSWEQTFYPMSLKVRGF